MLWRTAGQEVGSDLASPHTLSCIARLEGQPCFWSILKTALHFAKRAPIV
jgi:hypothetical protein